MEIIYAALLLHKAGKEVNETNVKKVLEAAQVKVDETKIKALIASLENVDIEKVIKEAAVPVAAAPAQKEEKKEEKKPKKEEKKDTEAAAAGLASLFG